MSQKNLLSLWLCSTNIKFKVLGSVRLEQYQIRAFGLSPAKENLCLDFLALLYSIKSKFELFWFGSARAKIAGSTIPVINLRYLPVILYKMNTKSSQEHLILTQEYQNQKKLCKKQEANQKSEYNCRRKHIIK